MTLLQNPMRQIFSSLNNSAITPLLYSSSFFFSSSYPLPSCSSFSSFSPSSSSPISYSFPPLPPPLHFPDSRSLLPPPLLPLPAPPLPSFVFESFKTLTLSTPFGKNSCHFSVI